MQHLKTSSLTDNTPPPHNPPFPQGLSCHRQRVLKSKNTAQRDTLIQSGNNKSIDGLDGILYHELQRLHFCHVKAGKDRSRNYKSFSPSHTESFGTGLRSITVSVCLA